MGTRLDELAAVIRSKNAGPCVLTFDLIFADDEKYRFVCERLGRLKAELASRLGLAAEAIAAYEYLPARAIKLTAPRPCVAGDPDDRDVYGAQQHAPLLGIAL